MTPTIPPTIKQHRYAGLYGRVWSEVNVESGIVTAVICGKRGTGKSWTQMELARILDRDEYDNCRFQPDDMCFSISEFFEKLIGDYPRGKVHCLDDAGLHMFNKDALMDILKRVSKTLQNIRYKHPIILMSLPYFKQLFIDAREMTDLYMEMLGRENSQNFISVQTLKVSAFTGDLYRYNLNQSRKTVCPDIKQTVSHQTPVPFKIDRPSNEIVRDYEKKKKVYLDQFNKGNFQHIKEKEIEMLGVNKKHQTFPEALVEVLGKWKDYVNTKGKFDTALLMADGYGATWSRNLRANLDKRMGKEAMELELDE